MFVPRPKTSVHRFVVARYRADGSGNYLPEAPALCRVSFDPSFCKIFFHCSRARKAGPIHKLAVFHCSAHKIYFTVYPPGWAPWLRLPLQAMNPEGYPIDDDDIFVASKDLAFNKKWLETNAKKMVFRTQRGHVHFSAKILGFHPHLKSLHPISLVLDLPELDLRASAERARDGPLRIMGKEGVAILQALRDQNEKKLSKLYHAGREIGLWGTPILSIGAHQ